MITAEDARRLSHIIPGKELRDIEKKIVSAAKSGKKSMYLYKPLSDEAERQLKQSGFGIESLPDKDGVTILVSWIDKKEKEVANV